MRATQSLAAAVVDSYATSKHNLSKVHLLRVNVTLLSQHADEEAAKITATCAVMHSKPHV